MEEKENVLHELTLGKEQLKHRFLKQEMMWPKEWSHLPTLGELENLYLFTASTMVGGLVIPSPDYLYKQAKALIDSDFSGVIYVVTSSVANQMKFSKLSEEARESSRNSLFVVITSGEANYPKLEKEVLEKLKTIYKDVKVCSSVQGGVDVVHEANIYKLMYAICRNNKNLVLFWGTQDQAKSLLEHRCIPEYYMDIWPWFEQGPCYTNYKAAYHVNDDKQFARFLITVGG